MKKVNIEKYEVLAMQSMCTSTQTAVISTKLVREMSVYKTFVCKYTDVVYTCILAQLMFSYFSVYSLAMCKRVQVSMAEKYDPNSVLYMNPCIEGVDGLDNQI
uniref:Uncharacterized protein n=1 Tax=Glossina brevipalpis TaxID=37001 RepID=A0A1A9WD63_9MUSC